MRRTYAGGVRGLAFCISYAERARSLKWKRPRGEPLGLWVVDPGGPLGFQVGQVPCIKIVALIRLPPVLFREAASVGFVLHENCEPVLCYGEGDVTGLISR